MILVIFLILAFCFWHFFLRYRIISLKNMQKFNLMRNNGFEQEYNFSDQRSLKHKNQLNVEDQEQDIQLFDPIANLVFEKQIKNQEFQCADQIQYEFLNKCLHRLEVKLSNLV